MAVPWYILKYLVSLFMSLKARVMLFKSVCLSVCLIPQVIFNLVSMWHSVCTNETTNTWDHASIFQLFIRALFQEQFIWSRSADIVRMSELKVSPSLPPVISVSRLHVISTLFLSYFADSTTTSHKICPESLWDGSVWSWRCIGGTADGIQSYRWAEWIWIPNEDVPLKRL